MGIEGKAGEARHRWSRQMYINTAKPASASPSPDRGLTSPVPPGNRFRQIPVKMVGPGNFGDDLTNAQQDLAQR